MIPIQWPISGFPRSRAMKIEMVLILITLANIAPYRLIRLIDIINTEGYYIKR